MKRLATLSLFCGILALNPGTAQDQKTSPSVPAKPQRAVYAVINGDALPLAEVAEAHFRGEARVIAAPGNVVLVSGTAAAEVLKLLQQLDKKPRVIEVEVTLAQVLRKDWKDGEVNVNELAKTGQRIKLTVVEGQPVSTEAGGTKPLSSKDIGFGGKGEPSVSYQDVGTTLKLTARPSSGDAVAIDLSVKDSQVKHPEPGDEVRAPSMVIDSLTARVTVPTGKAVVARAVRTEGKNGATIAVMIVTARVLPDAAPPKDR